MRVWKRITYGLVIVACTLIASGCMSITITAREASTVTVTQEKPVSVPTNATITPTNNGG